MVRWIDDYLVRIMGAILLITFVLGLLCGAMCCSCRRTKSEPKAMHKGKGTGYTETPSRKMPKPLESTEQKLYVDKQSQAPCTYKWKYTSPRFVPLPECSHG